MSKTRLKNFVPYTVVNLPECNFEHQCLPDVRTTYDGGDGMRYIVKGCRYCAARYEEIRLDVERALEGEVA